VNKQSSILSQSHPKDQDRQVVGAVKQEEELKGRSPHEKQVNGAKS